MTVSAVASPFRTLMLTGLITAMMSLSACSLLNRKPNCSDPAVTQAAAESVREAINQNVRQRVKEAMDQGKLLDLSMLPPMLKSLDVQVRDSVSGSSNRSEQYCQAAVTVDIPANLIQQAGLFRQASGQPTLPNLAVLSDVELDNGQVRQKLAYEVIKNNSGAIAVNLDKPGNVEFVSQVLYDAVRQATLVAQTQLNPQVAGSETDLETPPEQTTTQRTTTTTTTTTPTPTPAEQSTTTATATAPSIAAAAAAGAVAGATATSEPKPVPLTPLQKARNRFKTAESRLNRTWNAADSEARSALRSEQRTWKSQRDSNCELDSAAVDNANAREIALLNCKARATEARVPTIRAKLRAATPAESDSSKSNKSETSKAESSKTQSTRSDSVKTDTAKPRTDSRVGPAGERSTESETTTRTTRTVETGPAAGTRDDPMAEYQAQQAARAAAEAAARRRQVAQEAEAARRRQADQDAAERRARLQARAEQAAADAERQQKQLEESSRAQAAAERRAIEERVAQENAERLSRGIREAQEQLNTP